MHVYEYTDYKRFLQAAFEALPKKGRGQARQLAEHLRVHPVVVSQVLSGKRDFSHEQALDVAGYLGLDDRATDYFTTLVLKARAGTKRLEAHLNKKLEALRKEATAIRTKFARDRKLSSEEMGVFYSNWYYSGVRLLTSVPGFDNVDAIAGRFGLARAKVVSILGYLLERGLCNCDDRGRYSMGTTSTFIDGESPFADGHHRNWRQKAIEAMVHQKQTDFFFTSPCSISKSDVLVLRQEIKELIARYRKIVDASPAEQVACLNIDLFEP